MKKLAFVFTNVLALAPKTIDFALGLVTGLGNALIGVLEDVVRLVEAVDSYLEDAFKK